VTRVCSKPWYVEGLRRILCSSAPSHYTAKAHPCTHLRFNLPQAKLGDKMNSAVFDEREIKYIEGSSI
jgi:hypothetical protein